MLLIHHGPVLWAQRWLRVKLTVLLLAMPPLGWLLCTQLIEPEQLAQTRLGATLTAMAVALGIGAWLGRIKPRLGQRPRRRGA